MTNPAPNVLKLESIAIQAKQIHSTIRVDVADGYVLLQLIAHGSADKLQVQAGYTFYYGPGFAGTTPVLTKKPGRSTSSIGQTRTSEDYLWHDKSIANSLKWLIDDWGHGTPDFDTISTEAKKPPVKGPELDQLMLAVWLEAFGRDLPEATELATQVDSSRQKHQSLREQCFQWLRSGRVSKWNNLSVNQLEAVGKLGQCQFGGYQLAGVDLSNQDLRGSDFRDADLQDARLGGADCRDVDFRGANLSKAWLSGGKFRQADFSSAKFCNGAIRAADCQGAVFSGTDMSGVDFSFADLRNVDLSSANLNQASLFRIKYDERTRFPAGFVIDPELRMEWKGAKQRSPEYRRRCSLEELVSLIPPPRKPSDVAGRWEEAEVQMGFRFPPDFKKFICTYGSGAILGDLHIFNPLTASGRQCIAEELEILEEMRESGSYLWSIHPEESGILPWGRDTNGNVFCWLSKGEPDNWQTGQFGHGADEPEFDDVNITTFLFNYARNQYPEMLGGLTFEESDYKFSSD